MTSDFNSLDAFEFEALAQAINYKRWIWEQFSSTLMASPKILEVGGGIGHFTEVIYEHAINSQITSLEPFQEFYEQLAAKLPQIESFHGYAQDLAETEHYDSIINVNVLEHIKDHEDELKTWHRLLKENGTACVLVPACTELYTPIDHLMGHYRRYTPDTLREVFESAGFKVEKLTYFNHVGYWLWMLNFKLLKKKSFSKAKIAFHERYLIQPSKLLDKLGAHRLRGQSLVCIARKLS
ncbi:MAG TPA: hypothetical protein DCX06_04485 [Opitutae bacterium]|nr:hypothetical protein [Opitutae bacterium]